VHLFGFIIRMYHDARFCEYQRKKAKWIGHISLRNCLLERVIEGKIRAKDKSEGKTRERRMYLLHNFRERKGYSKLKRGSTRWHSVENMSVL